ncbi:MAG: catalase family peroxidase [Janthinobacterium lividum]
MAGRSNGWRAILGLAKDARPPIGRLAVIGLVAGATMASFVYAAGWASPARLSPATVADALQANTGQVFPGFRRAHAKGLCIVGRFESNGQGEALSKAFLFRTGTTTPVFGRFSTGGGNPFSPDGRVAFHALALEFRLQDGSQWRTAMDDTPMFPVGDANSFVALMHATTPDPATQQPDMAKLEPYLAKHPETVAFLDWMKRAPLPSSFANSPYNSIDAFRFMNASGQIQTVRWSFQPEALPEAVDKASLKSLNPDFLFNEFISRVRQAPQRWRLMITLASPYDTTDNATIVWPDTDRQVEVGTLVLDRAIPEDQAASGPYNCRDVNFDPLVLPSGISPSDDPLLPARSSVYAASYQRRSEEPSGTSAIDKIADHRSGDTQ